MCVCDKYQIIICDFVCCWDFSYHRGGDDDDDEVDD